MAYRDAPTPSMTAQSLLIAEARTNGELVPFAEYKDGRWQLQIPPQNSPSEFVPDDKSLADRVAPWFADKTPLNSWYVSEASGEVVLITASANPQKLGAIVKTFGV